MCESWSGQCQCIEGVGGLQCDECARGFKGVVPYCEPCGECFESWDSIITGLIEDTANVLEKVANIQEKGVAGAYDSQFAEIERYLNNAKSVLESNKDMKKLEDFMGDIESETTRGETRLADIHGSFVEIEELNDTQKRELHEIEQTIETYRNELKELSTKLDRVEAKDPIILWQRIDEAVRNATKYEILAKVCFFLILKNFEFIVFGNIRYLCYIFRKQLDSTTMPRIQRLTSFSNLRLFERKSKTV